MFTANSIYFMKLFFLRCPSWIVFCRYCAYSQLNHLLKKACFFLFFFSLLKQNKFSVTRKEFQLVVVTCLFIATKYEEITFPDINKITTICDNRFSKKYIFKMEVKILKSISFQLGLPLPLHFLRRITTVASHIYDFVSLPSTIVV